MTLQIRDGIEADHQSVLSLAKALPQWFSEKGIKEIAQDLGYECLLIAEENSEIAGFLSYYTYNGVGHLAWIGVLPEHHRKGIGTKLVHEFERRMSADRIQVLELKTLSDSEEHEPYERTRRFYERMGFRPLVSHNSEAWMARPERNPVRARTAVRNRAGFPRERSHAALVDVSFGANKSANTGIISPQILDQFLTIYFTPFAPKR